MKLNEIINRFFPGIYLLVRENIDANFSSLTKIKVVDSSIILKDWTEQARKDAKQIESKEDFMFVGMRPDGYLRWYMVRDYVGQASIVAREFEIERYFIE